MHFFTAYQPSKYTHKLSPISNISLIVTLITFSSLFGANWELDQKKSHIRFSGSHAGVTFTGNFPSFTGDIYFEDQNIEKTQATISIALNQVVVSDYYYQETLLTEDWFNVKNHPQAQFELQQLKAHSNEAYTHTAVGKLTLRGISKTLRIPLKLSTKDDQAFLDASVKIDRSDFKIGMESDPDGSWVSKFITVDIKLVAKALA